MTHQDQTPTQRIHGGTHQQLAASIPDVAVLHTDGRPGPLAHVVEVVLLEVVQRALGHGGTSDVDDLRSAVGGAIAGAEGLEEGDGQEEGGNGVRLVDRIVAVPRSLIRHVGGTGGAVDQQGYRRDLLALDSLDRVLGEADDGVEVGQVDSQHLDGSRPDQTELRRQFFDAVRANIPRQQQQMHEGLGLCDGDGDLGPERPVGAGDDGGSMKSSRHCNFVGRLEQTLKRPLQEGETKVKIGSIKRSDRCRVNRACSVNIEI